MALYFMAVVSYCFLCPACQKEVDNHSAPPDIDTGDSTVSIPLETTKLIYTSASEMDSAGHQQAYLAAYNPDLSLKWKQPGVGDLPVVPDVYGNGTLFFSSFSYTKLPDGSHYYDQYLFATDANTGVEKWKITTQHKSYNPGFVRNDTLYCGYAESEAGNFNSTNYIAALQASTGKLLWKEVIADPYGPTGMAVDGNILYYISYDYTTVGVMNAWSLSTHRLVWQKPLTILVSSGARRTATDFYISGNYINVMTGLHTLLSLNKANGATVWEKEETTYEIPIGTKKLVYVAKDDDGLYALDQATGVPAWHYDIGSWSMGGMPFLSGNTIYVMGLASTIHTTPFIAALNSTTGAEIWRKDNTSDYYYHLVAGKTIYAFRSDPDRPVTDLIDADNGAVLDSIVPPAGARSVAPAVLTVSGNYLVPNP